MSYNYNMYKAIFKHVDTNVTVKKIINTLVFLQISLFNTFHSLVVAWQRTFFVFLVYSSDIIIVY